MEVYIILNIVVYYVFLKEPCISAGILVSFRTLSPPWWNLSAWLPYLALLKGYTLLSFLKISFRFDDTTKTRDKKNMFLTLCIANNANAFIHGCNSVVLIIF